MSQRDFRMAVRAFELFTLHEREQALEIFAKLRYPSVTDRFFEAVHRVIIESSRSVGAVDPQAQPSGKLTPREDSK